MKPQPVCVFARWGGGGGLCVCVCVCVCGFGGSGLRRRLDERWVQLNRWRRVDNVSVGGGVMEGRAEGGADYDGDFDSFWSVVNWGDGLDWVWSEATWNTHIRNWVWS